MQKTNIFRYIAIETYRKEIYIAPEKRQQQEVRPHRQQESGKPSIQSDSTKDV